MSNLNNRKALDPRWTKWALPTLRAFETCIIAIYDPNSETSGDDYSPYAAVGEPGFPFGSGPFGEGAFGSGGGTYNQTSAPTLLWQGPGQLAVFRQSLTADDVAGSVTQLRSVRFTVDLDGPQMPVRKGLMIRVISCPHDRDAEAYEYIVTSGINSGLAWKRTIEAESDMSVIVTPIP